MRAATYEARSAMMKSCIGAWIVVKENEGEEFILTGLFVCLRSVFSLRQIVIVLDLGD